MHDFVLSHCHKEVVKGSPTLSVVEFFETVNRIMKSAGVIRMLKASVKMTRLEILLD